MPFTSQCVYCSHPAVYRVPSSVAVKLTSRRMSFAVCQRHFPQLDEAHHNVINL